MYTTDEKRNIDRKDEQRLPSYFLRITASQDRTSWQAAIRREGNPSGKNEASPKPSGFHV